jgi:hypothetical protein
MLKKWNRVYIVYIELNNCSYCLFNSFNELFINALLFKIRNLVFLNFFLNLQIFRSTQLKIYISFLMSRFDTKCHSFIIAVCEK